MKCCRTNGRRMTCYIYLIWLKATFKASRSPAQSSMCVFLFCSYEDQMLSQRVKEKQRLSEWGRSDEPSCVIDFKVTTSGLVQDKYRAERLNWAWCMFSLLFVPSMLLLHNLKSFACTHDQIFNGLKMEHYLANMQMPVSWKMCTDSKRMMEARHQTTIEQQRSKSKN